MRFGLELYLDNGDVFGSNTISQFSPVHVLTVQAGTSGAIPGFPGCSAFAFPSNGAPPSDPGPYAYSSLLPLACRVGVINGTLFWEPPYASQRQVVRFTNAQSTIVVCSGHAGEGTVPQSAFGVAIKGDNGRNVWNSDMGVYYKVESGSVALNTKTSHSASTGGPIYRITTKSFVTAMSEPPLVVGKIVSGAAYPIAAANVNETSFSVIVRGLFSGAPATFFYDVYARPSKIAGFSLAGKHGVATYGPNGELIGVLDHTLRLQAYGALLTTCHSMNIEPARTMWGNHTDANAKIVLNSISPISSGISPYELYTNGTVFLNGSWSNTELTLADEPNYTNGGMWRQTVVLQK